MRNTLLYLSRSSRLRVAFARFRFARRISRRFVAGETQQDAIDAIRRARDLGLLATVDHLGENVTRRGEARAAAEEYLQLLDRIAESGVTAYVSLKLTQMGLDLGTDVAAEHVRLILDRARQHDNFVRIDMESSAYTQRTLDLYESLRQAGYDNVGVVIQSYLRRSLSDVRQLVALGANVRLCKGAYQEPATVAFPRKRDVDESFLECARLLFGPQARQNGAYAAIATHDERIIAGARALAAEAGLSQTDYEFQMLYGVRRDLQLRLVQEGYRVRVYIPYGTEWYPYFMRRLAERPANVVFLARSLLLEQVR